MSSCSFSSSALVICEVLEVFPPIECGGMWCCDLFCSTCVGLFPHLFLFFLSRCKSHTWECPIGSLPFLVWVCDDSVLQGCSLYFAQLLRRPASIVSLKGICLPFSSFNVSGLLVERLKSFSSSHWFYPTPHSCVPILGDVVNTKPLSQVMCETNQPAAHVCLV